MRQPAILHVKPSSHQGHELRDAEPHGNAPGCHDPGYSYPGFHDTPFFFPTTVYHLYHHLAHQRQPLPPLCTAGDHICAIQREPWDVTERDEMM